MNEEFNIWLILHRLDSIAENQLKLDEKLSAIEEKLTKVETIKQSVYSLNKWKDDTQKIFSIDDLISIKKWKYCIDEVASPTQLKETIVEVNKLKTFKTQGLMIWVVIQAILAIIIFFDKVLIK